jgi:hypothetical protein
VAFSRNHLRLPDACRQSPSRYPMGNSRRETIITPAGKIVLDVLYERRSPFNPSEVVAEIVAQYRRTKIVGDKYGAQWTVEAFAKARARYEQSELDRSAIYMNTLPIFASGRARLISMSRRREAHFYVSAEEFEAIARRINGIIEAASGTGRPSGPLTSTALRLAAT